MHILLQVLLMIILSVFGFQVAALKQKFSKDIQHLLDQLTFSVMEELFLQLEMTKVLNFGIVSLLNSKDLSQVIQTGSELQSQT